MSKVNDGEELSCLKARVDEINMFPVSEKTQLGLSLGLIKLKPWHSLRYWVIKQW